jgi:hypothetical protein
MHELKKRLQENPGPTVLAVLIIWVLMYAFTPQLLAFVLTFGGILSVYWIGMRYSITKKKGNDDGGV